jgi:hypothetical protein
MGRYSEDELAALVREKAGYELQLKIAEEAGDEDRVKLYTENVKAVEKELRSATKKADAPAKRTEKRPAPKVEER